MNDLYKLRNKDHTELYWSEEYGWVDVKTGDIYLGYELNEYKSVLENIGAEWVSVDSELEEEFLICGD